MIFQPSLLAFSVIPAIEAKGIPELSQEGEPYPLASLHYKIIPPIDCDTFPNFVSLLLNVVPPSSRQVKHLAFPNSNLQRASKRERQRRILD